VRWKYLFLSLIASYGFSACDSSLTPTYTSRMGLLVPQINACSWGTSLNYDWNIIDSSTPILSKSNSYNTSQYFNGIVSSGTAKFYNNPGIEILNNSNIYLESTQGDIATIKQNCVGASCLDISNGISPYGIGINNGYGSSGGDYAAADLVICSRSGGCGGLGNYGTIALNGANSIGNNAYSGFTATGPITQSTLWSLPRADGTNLQPLVTDGSAHLSFSSSLSTTTFVGAINLWNMTISAINSLIASTTGQMVFCSNCTAAGGKGTICVSTGSTTTSQFVLSTGTVCK